MTFLRGALVQFVPAFGIPLPNIIIFQFNPETMTHAWTQPEAAPAAAAPSGGVGGSAGAGATPPPTNPLAVKGNPGESFTFKLVLSAIEPIVDGNPISGPLAQVSGIYTRLAALEMLQYPTGNDALGALVGSVSAGLGGGGPPVDRTVPANQIPTVLFVWGPGRIVPVRVTSFSVTEQLYDGLLNPTQAEANLTLRVLTPEELAFVTGPLSTIANGAYTYSQALRQALALANLANSVESVIGMLPI